MATLINLNDLLRHEILDLYSAEEQIIEALPKMIEKANNGNLKKALRDHLKVTEQQKNRLDQVKEIMGNNESDEDPEEKKGFFSRLFGGGQKCKGTEGLIEEGEKMMGDDMSPEALDAAIIASAQKIEHYEISGYGTARAFARELKMENVVGLLTETLNEEYQADDQLTKLAVGKLNIDAEHASDTDNRNVANSNGTNRKTSSNNQSKKSSSKGTGNKKGQSSSKNAGSASSGKASKKSDPGSAAKKNASKGSSNKSSSKKASGKSIKKASKSSRPTQGQGGPAKKSAGIKRVPGKSVAKSSSSKKSAKSSTKKSGSKKSRSSARR